MSQSCFWVTAHRESPCRAPTATEQSRPGPLQEHPRHREARALPNLLPAHFQLAPPGAVFLGASVVRGRNNPQESALKTGEGGSLDFHPGTAASYGSLRNSLTPPDGALHSVGETGLSQLGNHCPVASSRVDIRQHLLSSFCTRNHGPPVPILP